MREMDCNPLIKFDDLARREQDFIALKAKEVGCKDGAKYWLSIRSEKQANMLVECHVAIQREDERKEGMVNMHSKINTIIMGSSTNLNRKHNLCVELNSIFEKNAETDELLQENLFSYLNTKHQEYTERKCSGTTEMLRAVFREIFNDGVVEEKLVRMLKKGFFQDKEVNVISYEMTNTGIKDIYKGAYNEHSQFQYSPGSGAKN